MTLPATMRAVRAVDQKPVLVEAEVPQPGPGEVLVKVRATALNRADLMQAMGLYPPPKGASTSPKDLTWTTCSRPSRTG